MTISSEHLKAVCRLGEGRATCSFLVLGGAGMQCAKGTGIEQHIRARRDAGTMNAMGDNCSGWST